MESPSAGGFAFRFSSLQPRPLHSAVESLDLNNTRLNARVNGAGLTSVVIPLENSPRVLLGSHALPLQHSTCKQG